MHCRTGKLSYLSPQRAYRASAEAMGRSRTRRKNGVPTYYKCPYCPAWHTTHNERDTVLVRLQKAQPMPRFNWRLLLQELTAD